MHCRCKGAGVCPERSNNKAIQMLILTVFVIQNNTLFIPSTKRKQKVRADTVVLEV